jgi:hypothetical protein
MSQTKARSCEFYPQIDIAVDDFNILPFEKEMMIKEGLVQHVKNHDLGFT